MNIYKEWQFAAWPDLSSKTHVRFLLKFYPEHVEKETTVTCTHSNGEPTLLSLV
jgi:hypothetical protein